MAFLREKLTINQIVLLVLILVAVGSSGASLINNTNGYTAEWRSGWFQNFSTEVFGAIMTFALFELLVGGRKQKEAEFRKIEDLKARLLREAKSTVNTVAVQAINELRYRGWLRGEEGLLKDADLRFANLAGAYLSGANLASTNLRGVNLVGADLSGAQFNKMTVLPDSNWLGKDANDNSIFDKFWIPDTDMTRYTNPEHPLFWQPESTKEQTSEES